MNGTAPIPASSWQTKRHRLNKGGNRRLNHAIHMIAVTQARNGPARAPTSSAAAAKAERNATPCARSSATSPTSSTSSSEATPRNPETQTHAWRDHALDIDRMERCPACC
jgi:Transposase IS116/IS110/IS902 family